MTGKEIKALRKRLGMNQQAFGGLFGVTHFSVSVWENDHQRPKRGHVLWMLALTDRLAHREVSEAAFKEISDHLKQGSPVAAIASLLRSLFSEKEK